MPEYPQPKTREFVDISTLVTMMPVALIESKPGLVPGEYTIPAVNDPMVDLAVVHIYRAKYPVYIDENRPAIVVPEPSDRVADAIIRDYKVAVTGYDAGKAEPGLFWVPGKHTAEEILAKFPDLVEQARNLQTEWFKALFNQAEDDWAKYRIRRMIGGIQKVAAKALKLEPEWSIDSLVNQANNPEMIPCKYCKSLVNNTAMICPHCSGVLDVERYKKEFVSVASLGLVAKA